MLTEHTGLFTRTLIFITRDAGMRLSFSDTGWIPEEKTAPAIQNPEHVLLPSSTRSVKLQFIHRPGSADDHIKVRQGWGAV